MGEKVELGTPFQLKAGANSVITGGNDKVYLKKVEEDSRCPKGAQCMWAGQAVITVCINKDEAKITLPGAGDPKPVSLGGYLITFQNLQPYPVAGEAVDVKAYEVTLKVETE